MSFPQNTSSTPFPGQTFAPPSVFYPVMWVPAQPPAFAPVAMAAPMGQQPINPAYIQQIIEENQRLKRALQEKNGTIGSLIEKDEAIRFLQAQLAGKISQTKPFQDEILSKEVARLSSLLERLGADLSNARKELAYWKKRYDEERGYDFKTESMRPPPKK